MGKNERMNLIKKIEEKTDSRVIVYITGDRKGLETRISPDVIPYIFKHISKFGQVPKINLFIYTPGGITISGFSIVNMIREFGKKFGVIIPSKSLSTGTLIALGADEIIMSKMGQMGPVDPSLEHPLGPKVTNPQNPTQQVLVPVNVEDVVSFFDLAKKHAKLEEGKELKDVLMTLANSVHPLVLGAVNRSRNEIRFLSKTLLSMHIDDKEKIDTIVRTLLEERFSHSYLIGRNEAKNILGLNVIDVSDELDHLVMELFEEYSELLKLDSSLNLELELGTETEKEVTFTRCIVESIGSTHTFTTVRKIKRVIIKTPQGIPQPQYLQTLIQEEWIKNDEI